MRAKGLDDYDPGMSNMLDEELYARGNDAFKDYKDELGSP